MTTKGFKINAWFTAISIALCTVFYGLLLLPILGFTQLLTSVLLWMHQSKLTKLTKTHLSIYSILTIMVLLSIVADNNGIELFKGFTLPYAPILGGGLAIYHVFITYLAQNKTE